MVARQSHVVEPRLRVVERGGGGPGRAEAPPVAAAVAVAAVKDRRLPQRASRSERTTTMPLAATVMHVNYCYSAPCQLLLQC